MMFFIQRVRVWTTYIHVYYISTVSGVHQLMEQFHMFLIALIVGHSFG